MYKQLAKIISESENIVFFGGAGVSTESDIPDFRSEEGLYNAKKKYKYSPETLISHRFFINNTEIFYDYYVNNLIYLEAKPNDAHKALAKLEDIGKLKALITQNIDGLHQMAGSRNVLELHGSIHRNYCVKCRTTYDLNYIIDAHGVPRCKKCGGIVRPDVVLYGEGLDDEVIGKSVKAIQDSDVLIVGGTSLVVYPAAGLIDYFKGKKLVLINKTSTTYDNSADLVINEPIGKVMKEVIQII